MNDNKIMSDGKPDSEELILEIGAEGGSLIIRRFLAPDGTWKFIVITDKSTLADFLDEADQKDLVKKYLPVDTFEEALQLMDKYPWQALPLISVHPEYAVIVQSKMNDQPVANRRRSLNTPGPLTSEIAGSITREMNEKGYDVYFDHGIAGEFIGTIPVSIEKDTEMLAREEEISQLDIAIVKRNANEGIALVEIEETTDNPKKLIGDIFAVLMGNSIYLPGGEKVDRKKVDVGKWTTLIIIVKGAGHEERNEYILKMVDDAKSALKTVNAGIGHIVIKSFSAKDDLKETLLEQIEEAIQSIT